MKMNFHRQLPGPQDVKNEYPITERIHDEELSLPCHPAMSNEEVQAVISAANSFKG